ncbi:MAG TPA: chorismate mutase, partial [Syntrophobacteraceae bacterium]|nr:chorismate mutase [Syntrophobacteraceae bacterium]
SAALSDAAQQVTPEQLGTLLNQLDIKHASTDDPEYLNDISYNRSIIDVVDEQIMELLAQRMKISTEIGRLKKRKNISILQPERLRKMLADRVESSRAKGLSESFLLQLFRRIHEESIRHQESAGANDQTQLSWRRDPEEYS